MATGKESLGKLVPQQGVSCSLMRVDSVREDGTVNLLDGTILHPGIPCHTGYLNRAAGDKVVVMRWQAGWFVLGKAGPASATTKALSLSWGQGAPAGSGWLTGTLWVRDGELYVETAAPPPLSAKPVTLQPTTQGAWRSGSRDNDQAPSQGAWSSYPHPYTGAWFYGSQITALSGTPTSMSIRVARTSATHGVFGGVKPRFYLLAASAAGSATPALGDGPKYGPALGLGASASWTLPGSWRDALASGAAHGIGITAEVGSGYLICTDSCGQLTVNF